MSDMHRDMCIQQGYVPKTCIQDGSIVWGAMQVNQDPCGYCDKDREICKGRKLYVERKEAP